MVSTSKALIWSAIALIVTVVAIGCYLYYEKPTEPGNPKTEVAEVIDLSGVPRFFISQVQGVQSAVNEYWDSWRIHFLDVGQGDAILIQGSMHNILIDGGDESSGITEYLTELAIDTLHWVVATHPHADHIAGVIDVFRKFPVVNVMDPGVIHTSQIYKTYQSLIDSAATTYIQGFSGWYHSFTDDFLMQVVHPDTLKTYDINNASLVMRFKMGETYALFTGDAEIPAEQAMLLSGQELRSQIIKIGHHGSKTSSHEDFILAVEPQTGFILCGRDNKYKFPHEETLEVFHKNNTTLFQTDIHGSLLITVNPLGYKIFAERQGFVKPVGSLPGAKININTADLTSLTRIIHIGEATAKSIIESRPFVSLEDLQRVRGIGSRKIEDIRQQGLASVE
jgi:competence protein ComEC